MLAEQNPASSIDSLKATQACVTTGGDFNMTPQSPTYGVVNQFFHSAYQAVCLSKGSRDTCGRKFREGLD